MRSDEVIEQAQVTTPAAAKTRTSAGVPHELMSDYCRAIAIRSRSSGEMR